MSEQLSGHDVAVLAFETEWWTLPGGKDLQIRERFAMTSVRYYQLLNVLIDRPEALAQAPLTVKRLHRLRSRRRARPASAGLDIG